MKQRNGTYAASVLVIIGVAAMWLSDARTTPGAGSHEPQLNEARRSRAPSPDVDSALANARANLAKFSELSVEPKADAPIATIAQTPVPSPITPQPAPRITIDSPDSKPLVQFDELLGRHGNRLAKNVEYVRNSGRLAILNFPRDDRFHSTSGNCIPGRWNMSASAWNRPSRNSRKTT